MEKPQIAGSRWPDQFPIVFQKDIQRCKGIPGFVKTEVCTFTKPQKADNYGGQENKPNRNHYFLFRHKTIVQWKHGAPPSFAGPYRYPWFLTSLCLSGLCSRWLYAR